MSYKLRDYGLCETLKEKKEREKRDLNYWRREKFENLNLNLHKFVDLQKTMCLISSYSSVNYPIFFRDWIVHINKYPKSS